MPTPVQKPAFRFRLDFPPELPISARAEEIVAAIQANPVVILAGETGSGKTTQIPKMCLAAGGGRSGMIACTQPRRVAALSVSRRVAEELGVEWGGPVGCKIRFDDHTSRDTVIKFLTDGMLLAEVQSDPMLRAYDTIILDEAHERSLNIDFLLGHLRTLRYRRPELRIVVTSATIDTAAFSAAFDGAPVIEVSGRTYPVEVQYLPLDAFGSDYVEDPDEPDREAERSAQVEALHYVDGAVAAVSRIAGGGVPGDVLVFLPSERDIREVRDALEGGEARGCEIVPLFGRLSNAEQQRVFAPSPRRKIVLATNIAETSLTIPGIRFVVDTGLARISRYSPQARTRRLPIEPVSQSSADQRKGRAGRVADGVCVRLYSEKDFAERPRFTQPEIQRANLADVILRLKAFGLGDIERFPFINPPAPKAIRAGYALLEEIGALRPLDAPPGSTAAPPASAGPISPERRDLTPVGRELARLPVDPTVGRMILQARAEKCVREVVVIAAGLSIQDPRERPLDKQAAADAAHRRFRHPDSDFLTLLAIWNAFHDEVERLTQAKLRRFCHDHFLSYVRLREWRDIHGQLMDVLEQREDFRLTSVFDGLTSPPDPAEALRWGTPAYRAIHRSILSGLLGNVAHYDEQARLYKAAHDRRVAVFPGSTLHRRDEGRRRTDAPANERKAPKPPRWIMASEIVETSRLYARTCAVVDPAWIADLGEHLVRVSHSEPFWSPESARVLVKRRTRLYGLELETRSVGYGRVDPVRATEIFIREALVADAVEFALPELEHNRRVRREVEDVLTRTRDRGYLGIDEALYRFYAARLLPESEDGEPVSAVAELVDRVRRGRAGDPHFLRLRPEDLREDEVAAHDPEAFPGGLPIENRVLPLAYAYRPGTSEDGVSVTVNLRDAGALTPAALDWAVPGHLATKVEHFLKALPKEQRRLFVPLAETVRTAADAVARIGRLQGGQRPLTDVLAEYLEERYQLRVDRTLWRDRPLPEHLLVRVRVTDDEGRELVSTRDLGEVRGALETRARQASATVAREEPEAWVRARRTWEKPPASGWTFGDVPDRVLVCEQAGVPVHAFPALVAGEAGVALRLVRSETEARGLDARGIAQLLESGLRYDLAWLEKELRALRHLGPLMASLAPADAVQADAFVCLRRWLLDAGRLDGRTERAYRQAIDRAKEDLRGLVPRFSDTLRAILAGRQAALVAPDPAPGMLALVETLVPPDFLRRMPYERLGHLARYLRAQTIRAERWRRNPAKDAERAREVETYAARIVDRPWDDPLRWLLEEFRVSVFAQELGTAEPVSAVKLERALAGERVQTGTVGAAIASTGAGPEPRSAPMPSVPARPAPKRPLKDLGALAAHFRR